MYYFCLDVSLLLLFMCPSSSLPPLFYLPRLHLDLAGRTLQSVNSLVSRHQIRTLLADAAMLTAADERCLLPKGSIMAGPAAGASK